MSYFDMDRRDSKFTPEVYVPITKDEIFSVDPGMTENDMTRIKQQMANTHSNTGWHSYWTQDINPFTEYVRDGTPQNPISSDEIRQYLPEEYKNFSLEELSEKLLEDDNGQEVLKEAINKAKTRNVKEKKTNECKDWNELQQLVEEAMKEQQRKQKDLADNQKYLHDLQRNKNDMQKGYDYFNLKWGGSD